MPPNLFDQNKFEYSLGIHSLVLVLAAAAAAAAAVVVVVYDAETLVPSLLPKTCLCTCFYSASAVRNKVFPSWRNDRNTMEQTLKF